MGKEKDSDTSMVTKQLEQLKLVTDIALNQMQVQEVTGSTSISYGVQQKPYDACTEEEKQEHREGWTIKEYGDCDCVELCINLRISGTRKKNNGEC